MSRPSDLFDESNPRVRVATLPPPVFAPHGRGPRHRRPGGGQRWLILGLIAAIVLLVLAGAAVLIGIVSARADESAARVEEYSAARQHAQEARDAFRGARGEALEAVEGRADAADAVTEALGAVEGYVDDDARMAAFDASAAYRDALAGLGLPEQGDELPAELSEDDPAERFEGAVDDLEAVAAASEE
jgi:type II secretory pathway pseudopilin PulG